MQTEAPPVVSIVGRSGSGKTSLIEKLIQKLQGRGYRIGTIKHHAHPGFDFDHPGKDTWRHAQAGSQHVIIGSPGKVAVIRQVPDDPPLDELAATMTEVDLILTEGYLWEDKPKIEVLRAARSTELLASPDRLMAVITDVDSDFGIPRFDLTDADGLVEFLSERFPLKTSNESRSTEVRT